MQVMSLKMADGWGLQPCFANVTCGLLKGTQMVKLVRAVLRCNGNLHEAHTYVACTYISVCTHTDTRTDTQMHTYTHKFYSTTNALAVTITT